MEYFNQRIILGVIAALSFILGDEVMPRVFEDALYFKGPNVIVWAHTALMVIGLVCGAYAAFGPQKIRACARDFAHTLDRLFG